MTPTATRDPRVDPYRAAGCEYVLWRSGHDRKCQQTVGLRSWYDSAGTHHTACPIHVAARLSVYPAADPPMPKWLHEDPAFAPESADPLTAAKGYGDWLESELREAHGG